MKKDQQNAIRAYDKVIKNHPTEVSYLLERADIQLELNNTEEALSDLNKAIALDLSNDKAYFGRGLILFDQYKDQQAIDSFTSAIKLNVKDDSYFLWRACAQVRLKNYEDAIRDCSSAIAISPNSTDGYKRRAQAFRLNKQTREAIKDYATVLRLTPKDKDAQSEIARLSALCAEVTAKRGKLAAPVTQSRINPKIRPTTIVLIPEPAGLNAPRATTTEVPKPTPAHTIQTFSGGSFSTRQFDRDGHPID